jgi:hypothetical protein
MFQTVATSQNTRRQPQASLSGQPVALTPRTAGSNATQTSQPRSSFVAVLLKALSAFTI